MPLPPAGQPPAVSAADPPGAPAGQPHAPACVTAPDRPALLRRYRELVDRELPERAAQDRWVLRHDHCFGRVLLDHAVRGCWYDVLDRRSAAFRQLDDDQLAGAVALGERLLEEGDPLLRALDAQSLQWRGKPPKRVRRTD